MKKYKNIPFGYRKYSLLARFIFDGIELFVCRVPFYADDSFRGDILDSRGNKFSPFSLIDSLSQTYSESSGVNIRVIVDVKPC